MNAYKNKQQQGFTLIELMIVVAVIGVLAAIAIPQYQNYVKKSEAAAAVATVRSLTTNIDTYIADAGTFPSDSNFTDIGAAAGMNKLGTIALDTASKTVKLTFLANNSVYENQETVVMTKGTDGLWTCTVPTGVTLKGCTAAAATPPTPPTPPTP
ncbi:type IV pilin protein [Vibrio metoecus]|uniref:Prepilin-type cleavage/methylation domain-containing protein n=3 Tax=Vibrio metoecus TaxID=1481663 RepID=A0A271VSM2_VIBMT|nr:prepilin-type N-terminal cleavage/methylation domain-containing protein [Vibrio metoecus]PAR21071.1 prepilin-type cleavage/methylation domain-containing protein [Vibrio metoecus]PAR24098.1 prepilin-type cleavage/methylation domain-containing protein [Vibrio metoecus]PAR35182.1 prepilin-type cleavage/methylation domain-containing protein [Vibrio metoecus]PAR44691.1 prepilin-type cleavage/methylation domain-containing protein [Vibrio metoecus]